jgi:hypothetical protein
MYCSDEESCKNTQDTISITVQNGFREDLIAQAYTYENTNRTDKSWQQKSIDFNIRDEDDLDISVSWIFFF